MDLAGFACCVDTFYHNLPYRHSRFCKSNLKILRRFLLRKHLRLSVSVC